MGMFDFIKNELFCPFCGIKQPSDSFQTKDFSKGMNSIDILPIKGVNYEIYHQCENCNTWIHLYINFDGVNTIEEGQKQIIKRQKEISKIFTIRNKIIKKKQNDNKKNT